MPFTEICVYQVKPQKVDEFETLMCEVKELLEKQEGLRLLRLSKREYHIDLEQIKEGLPPKKITRIVKSVKYMLYWEFDTKESYGLAEKNLYDSYWKSIEWCLTAPHDKYLGEMPSHDTASPLWKQREQIQTPAPCHSVMTVCLSLILISHTQSSRSPL